MFYVQFNRKGTITTPPDSQKIVRQLFPYDLPDQTGYKKTDTLFSVQCLNRHTASSKSLTSVPVYHEPSKTGVVAWARIDNRDELARAFDMPMAKAAALSDQELILTAYLKWGRACPTHLIGDYAFCVFDEGQNRVFCARDHMGIRPFYYHLADDRFVCAASPVPILETEGVPVRIKRKWIADYISHLSMSFDETPFQDIHKLPPAHSISITSETASFQQYFTLGEEPPLHFADSREYVDAYREKLETAVKCRINSACPVGSELSGGIDSSTVTAFGARLFDQPLSNFHAFAFANSEMEPQYILSVSQAFGLPHTHVMAGDPEEGGRGTERALAILGYPEEHGNGSFHAPFYDLARQFNIRTLLSGFGGDEFGTTIHGNLVPMALMLQKRYRDLYQRLPGNAITRMLRLAKLWAKKTKTKNFSLPEYAPRFLNAYQSRWPDQIVREELVHQYKIKARYFDEARFDAGYTDLKKFTLEKRWQPFVPTRTAECSLMAAATKIEYAWPLLDIRLVNLFLQIPSEENYFQGMGRFLHRRAIDGIVPDLVVWKKNKYMGTITGRTPAGTHRLLKAFSTKTLHPALTDIIDVEKLETQVKKCLSIEDDFEKIVETMMHRKIKFVMSLSNWLNRIGPEDLHD